MIGGIMFASSGRRTVWRHDVRDVAAPLGFARSWWKVRLRATGERETCWCKRGVSLVSGMIGGIM